MSITVNTPVVPTSLLRTLEKTKLQYARPVTVFHCVWLSGDNFAGVFGDGANGAYEWFDWREGKLETSNQGYGCTGAALRDVLLRIASFI